MWVNSSKTYNPIWIIEWLKTYWNGYIYIINCIFLARSDDCKTPICDFKEKSGRSLNENPDALLQPAEEGALMASYSVFVLEPGEQVGQYIFYVFYIVE